jgi:predicted nucleic acid-binding Zn ribbon protein
MDNSLGGTEACFRNKLGVIEKSYRQRGRVLLPMPFCSNCGTQLTEGAKFCQNCGSPMMRSSPRAAETKPKTSHLLRNIVIAILVVLFAAVLLGVLYIIARLIF